MKRRVLEKGRLFAEEIECELMNGFECKMCGRAGSVEFAQHPDLIRQGTDEVVVAYAVRCVCCETGFFFIRMPTLMFGHLLALSALGMMPNFRTREMEPIVAMDYGLLQEACVSLSQLTAPDKPRLGSPGNTSVFTFTVRQRIDKERALGIVPDEPEE